MGGDYSGLKPLAPWGGREVWSAAGPGGPVFLLDAAGAWAAGAPFLAHQNLPEYLGAEELDLPSGRKKVLVYRGFDALTLGEALQHGKCFAELEALNVAYEAVRVLKYLHGLSPAVAHGSIGAGGLLLAGGRVTVCPPLCSGTAAEDILAVAALMKELAKRPKGAGFGGQYHKVAEYLALPGADAAYAAKIMESLAARPMDAFPPPKPPRGVVTAASWGAKRLALTACAAILGVAALNSLRSLPAPSAGGVEDAAKLARSYPCAQLPAAEAKAREDENLLFNPSLEGPCGWRRTWGAFDKDAIRGGGAHGGKYYFRVDDPELVIYQDADVSALAPSIKSGRCRAELSGWLKSSGFGGDGDPYLYGYAMRSDEDYDYLNICQPVSSKEWTRSSCEFKLRPGTRRVRLLLQISDIKGAWFSKAGDFDDLSVKVSCD